MQKKILAVALPLLLLACSPAEEKRQNEAVSDKLAQSEIYGNATSAEKPGDIPGSSTSLPEINSALPPQAQTDSSSQGGGGTPVKKKTTQTKGKEEETTEKEKQIPVKHLIQTADIKMQVNNLDSTSDVIEALTKKYNAYVSAANQQTNNAVSESRITIRVAQENFSALIRELMKHSKFTNYKNIHTDDVSAEYVDIESRLKTKKEVEARYMQILRSNARTIDEVLRAENEIRVIHEEIEAKTGRLNFIKDQVSWSTINLDFYVQTNFSKEPEQVQYSWSGEMGSAFGAGWDFCKKLVIALTYLWPLYLVLLIVYLVLRKYVFKKVAKTA